METHITKIIEKRNEVRLVTNTSNIRNGAITATIGIITLAVPIACNISIERLSTTLVIAGGTMFFIGLFMLLSRGKKLVYGPTNSSIKQHYLFFDAKDKNRLCEIMNSECFFSDTKGINAVDNGQIRIDFLFSDDHKFACAQMLEYVGFNYEPITEPAYFCDESAQAAIDFLTEKSK
jgi:hypothetical protein